MYTLRNGLVAWSLAISALATVAYADGAIVSLMSDEEKQVLDEFDTRRDAAIDSVMRASDATASTMLSETLAGSTQSFDDVYDPTGDWRCRYLKLGGDPELTVYGWFSCRIFDDGAGWVIEKHTGSQRTMGRLYRLTAERLIYLGALHHSHETPLRFGDDPSRNQMAILTRLDDGRMRLEFPAPLFRSRRPGPGPHPSQSARALQNRSA